ncbi:unnamed protein product [Spirodela intermedia]|uniref:DYW domain-containing protein n=1 Tax=Spirodela intermedia TaxID=51605 RepID=A0A7I8KBN7_SPIIN|nr:unnamed protein product [Spirodela intermedia]
MAVGEVAYARRLFDEMYKPRVFLWSSLIRGYARNGLSDEAVAVFRLMLQQGVRPDSFTFPFLLRACADLNAAALGAAAHGLLVKHALPPDKVVATELMAMYAKSGDWPSADLVFDRMAGGGGRDLVAWNALMAAYAQSGRADRALHLLDEMGQSGLKPDAATMVTALSACSSLGLLQLGKKIHRSIVEDGLDGHVVVENALLDMYAKCGSVAEARRRFEAMRHRNVVSWSTMIAGYAMNGDGEEALALAARIRDEGVEPNHVTHLAVLSACAHAGIVSRGRSYFSAIASPTLEHYASMVDLLGRSGQVEEAYQLVKEMPVEPDAGVWGALLAACAVDRRVELGQVAADRLLSLAPDGASYQVLLSNMYAAAGRWGDVEKVRKRMRKAKVRKTAGYCSVEAAGGGGMEVFYGGDRSHPQSGEIYAKLEELMRRVRDAGYAPATGEVLHDVEAEEKEVALGAHSEKIAIAFSLIGAGHGAASIRVMKNLRTCSDCHAFAKLVSKVVGVEIIMRDKNRFHHFTRGSCSCRDFW